jgi:hypothetical protein
MVVVAVTETRVEMLLIFTFVAQSKYGRPWLFGKPALFSNFANPNSEGSERYEAIVYAL